MKENADLEKMRHTLSHVLAAAVKELYPTTTFGIGPAIDNGFYMIWILEILKSLNRI